MKRTKSINYAAFRKSWQIRHSAPVALAVAATFALAGCEKADESVHFYQNASDCSSANPGKSAECNATYQSALQEAARTAPKYASQQDCVAEFGEGRCQPVSSQDLSQASANQLNANQTNTSQSTSNQSTSDQNTSQIATSQQQHSSIWMPLMAGYLMGSVLNNGMYSRQPLFSSGNPASPAYGKYTDASGRNYGALSNGRTINVPKTAMAPKPATTSTITRGGFGESVARQSAAASRHSAGG